ncbi:MULTISPECIES: aspartate aminotransferase family protein [Alphaproteobacteria]|uniref:aspartate aminotransferase family protein n=1 Tax=Alphaproteobacteria TaxID=28211 RepID=UPI0025EA36CE|nr:aspartate aminotransferase family protein [Sphingobium sp. UBA5915]
MIDAPNSASARDISYHLHPSTNARRHEAIGPTIIDRGDGIYVYDDQGQEYIEGLAGLWSVAVGFSEDRLREAAYRQMHKLPYYHLFGHKSHEPAIELAERLVRMAPGNMSKAFFTNSGGEANDTALKLVRYYNNARGRPEKKKIISRNRAYHGVTIGAGSLTGIPIFHRDFDLPIPGVLHVGSPHFYREAQAGETEAQFVDRLACDLEDTILREGPETIAAFIGEPVMGAGGVILPPDGYWQRVQEICRRHDILLWIDEVICGFGRTGKTFGCDTYDIIPDIVVLSKQITSSYMPLGATLISDEIYQGVADNSAKIGALGHGITGGGHPVAVAVAVENLNILESDKLMERVPALSEHFLRRLHGFSDHPFVGETRGVGLIGAIELSPNPASRAPFDPPGKCGAYLMDAMQANGLITRAIGDAAVFCPPLIITSAQIDDLFDRFAHALDQTVDWYRRQEN